MNNKGQEVFNLKDIYNKDQETQISEVIQKISERNKQRFLKAEFKESDKNIQKNKKLSLIQDKIQHLILNKQFENGWEVNYTDNILSHENFRYGNNVAVFTFHGCPGNQNEWLRLEKSVGSDFIRWVNFIVPGYDGYDERRGDYNGTIQHIVQLVKMLVEYLKIDQIILMGHSMGSYICNYFYNTYPQLVFGFVEMSAAPIQWYVGMKQFYRSLVLIYSKEELEDQRLDSCEIYRKKVYERFMQNKGKYNIQNDDNIKGISLPIPYMNQVELICSIKFFYRSFPDFQWGQVFNYHRQLPLGLKFFAAGNTDIIIEKNLFEQTFYHYNFGQQGQDLQKILGTYNLAKWEQKIQQNQLLKEYQIDLKNLQSNFIFMFDNTGHPVHNRRGQELGQPIQIYIELLFVLKQFGLENKKIQQQRQYSAKL